MIRNGHYHLVGLAGAGMSALAQVLQAQGKVVSGSDRCCDTGPDPDVVRKLRAGGIRLHPQDGSGVTENTCGLVVSSAIEGDNADIAAAKALQVPVMHRSEILAGLVDGRRCVAVTGTSGKSTVTGMIGWMLEQAGADPVVVNGGVLLNWSNGNVVGNARCGLSDIWVIEADESDRSLLRFRPEWAVITNVSKDHFELQETVELFQAFSGQAKRGCISALDCPRFLQQADIATVSGESTFVYKGTEVRLKLPGKHNAENALYALALCEHLDFDLELLVPALAEFKGIQRRHETIGIARGVKVVDDYAHNPAKIRAAWEAMAPCHKRVHAVWRPHGFGPLAAMMPDLTQVFANLAGGGDRIYILPVYDAGGTADRGVNSDALVHELNALNAGAVAIKDPGELPRMISGTARLGDVVLLMGARDPGLPSLARAILSSLRASCSPPPHHPPPNSRT